MKKIIIVGTFGEKMKKTVFTLLGIVTIIFSNVIYAQDSNSIQINSGVIMPLNSSKGFSTSFQYNYQFSSNIQFYIYSGYSSWDKHNVIFNEDSSPVQKQTYFNSYSSDNHILIPVYIGSIINFHTNKLFTSFVTLELGYSYLSYNSYENIKEIGIETGEVIAYTPDQNSKKEINENLLGIGAGFGLLHPITENINMVLAFKLNSNLNSEYNKGAYTALTLGFNINI